MVPNYSQKRDVLYGTSDKGDDVDCVVMMTINRSGWRR